MPGSDQTEVLALLADMRSGSVAAFEHFYEQYAPFVLRLALKIAGDRMDAEDICHDVFLEALHKTDQYDPDRGSLEAWLAVKTKSRAVDLLRRKQRRAAEPLAAAEAPAGGAYANPAEQALQNVALETVQTALRQLPAEQRRAVYGLYVAGRTQKELAADMRRPLGTVKSFVRYGLLNIKKHLFRMGWLEPAEAGGDSGHGANGPVFDGSGNR